MTYMALDAFDFATFDLAGSSERAALLFLTVLLRDRIDRLH